MNRIMQWPIVSCLGLALAGCDLDIPNFNDPGLIELRTDPTAARVSAVATGLLIGTRSRYASANGYVSLLGILGRESYNLNIDSDPRFVTELLEGPLDPGSPAFGGNAWEFPYSNLWASNVLLDVLPDASEVSDEDKEGVRGFAKTIQVLDFLVVINSRDENGAPIELSTTDVNDLGPIRCKDAVFAHMVNLLEEARGHLENAGETFLFPLSGGFSGFDTPATFLRFNRALLARVEVYRGNFDEALPALDDSFIVRDATQLDLGVFHAFSGGSGDTTNALLNPNIVAHPAVRARAETSTVTGMIDARVTRKLVKLDEPVEAVGLSSDDDFAMYDNIASPLPIIRNEELLLLRAEAHIGLSNTASAAADINFIREVSGNLPRLPVAQAGTLDELLKQKRYSLLFEAGHRWIDMRRYGRLDALLDEDQRDDFTVAERFPIPLPEQLARGGAITCEP